MTNPSNKLERMTNQRFLTQTTRMQVVGPDKLGKDKPVYAGESNRSV